MMKKIFISVCTVICLSFLISAKSCTNNKKSTRIGSSLTYAFSINAPSGLIATVLSYDRVSLSWINNASNNDGFEIQRSLTLNSNYTTVATIDDVSFYLDSGLTAFNTYFYRVRALNTIGDRSGWSNEVLVTTTPIWSGISAGQYHSLALASDGTVWSWGENETAQLGIGGVRDKNMPTRIITDFNWAPFTGIISIASGDVFGVAAKDDRTLWAWGANGGGQFGIGDSSSTDQPSRMGITTAGYDFLAGWVDYAIGYSHTIVRKNNSTIYGCGNNVYGQLGIGSTIDAFAPTQIGAESDWSYISAGWMHTLAIKSNNTLYAWGYNQSGQLGTGDYERRYTPAAIGNNSDWVQAVGGGNFSLVRKLNNTIFSSGSDDEGQSGRDGDPRLLIQIGTASDWIDITAGFWHALAIKNNGTAHAWGLNGSGQLGIGDTINRNTPVQLGTDSDWQQLSAGQGHSLGLKNNGALYAWGHNGPGQLGINDNTNRSIPCPVGFYVRAPASLNANIISNTQVSLSRSDMSYNENGFKVERCFGVPITNASWYEIAAVSANVTLYADTAITPDNTYYYRVRGYNMYGYSAYTNSLLVTTIPPGNWSENFCAGNYHTLAIKTDGILWGWGRNDWGQLGLADTINKYTPCQVGSDSDWFSVTANGESGPGENNVASQSFGMKTNGTIWAWGNNWYGQLGVGDFETRITPALVNTHTDWSSVTAGVEHTLSIMNNQTLWSWGYNVYGQLGLGDSTDGTERNTPTQIGAASEWISASAGNMHSMAIKNNGTLWAWGHNLYGQLGLGTSGATNSKNLPNQVGVSADWSNVSAGYNFTVATKVNGTIWSWGGNSYGQLGLGLTNSSVKRLTPSQIGIDAGWIKPSASYQLVIAGKIDGTIWGWGNDYHYQLGQFVSNYVSYSPVQIGINTLTGMVSCGGGMDYGSWSGGHCIIINNGNLWGWGYTEDGQVGIGTTDDQQTPKMIEE